MHIKGIKLQAIDIHNLCYMFRRIFAVFRETIILRNLQKKRQINKSKFTCNVIFYVSSIIFITLQFLAVYKSTTSKLHHSLKGKLCTQI